MCCFTRVSSARTDWTIAVRGSNRPRQRKTHPLCRLTVRFDSYACPIIAPLYEVPPPANTRMVGELFPLEKMDKKVKAQYDSLLTQDPLYVLTAEDKMVLWMYRHHLTAHASMLKFFLQTVNWTDVNQRYGQAVFARAHTSRTLHSAYLYVHPLLSHCRTMPSVVVYAL